MINGLDLFSGIGGITLALVPWVRPLAYCENERFAQSILLSRMRTGHLPSAPIWDRVETLSREHFESPVDIMYGGFPCQDISVAGHGKGLAGKRSGLFFEIIRLVKEISPSFVFLENVPAIRTRGLDQVARAFAELRYDCRWTVVSAQEVGAPHIRKRWFLLAYSQHKRSFLDKNRLDLADANSEALREQSGWGGWESWELPHVNPSNGDSRFAAEPSKGTFKPRVSRTGNGIPFAMDRDRALGNSVVPIQAREAFERLMGLK